MPTEVTGGFPRAELVENRRVALSGAHRLGVENAWPVRPDALAHRNAALAGFLQDDEM